MTLDNMEYKFKDFAIARPVFIESKMPDEEYFKYNFSLIKYTTTGNFVIGHLTYNIKEGAFDFRSIGTRYLQYRSDGLEEWLLAWCNMKTIEICADER